MLKHPDLVLVLHNAEAVALLAHERLELVELAAVAVGLCCHL